MDSKRKLELMDELWTMIALLETKGEVRNFFKDLLSYTEALMLARRIKIAKLLLRDESYDWIAENLGTGYTTIASVHRWLQGGSGGYELAIHRFEKEFVRQRAVQEQKEAATVPLSKEWMRKRYPLHYFLSNMFAEDMRPPKKLRRR